MTSSPGVSQWADSSASPVLLREYQPVRLWLSGLGFLLFLIPSLVLGWIEGFGASALLLGMFIHAAIMLRRADISVLGVLLVDVTVIGAVSILARVPVVTALGFTLLVVVTGTFARRRHARLMWLYVGALFGVVLLIHEFLGPSGLTGGQVRLVSVIAMGIQLPGLAILVVRAAGRQRSADRLERESAARYRAVFEQSPVALWDSDFSGLKDWLV